MATYTSNYGWTKPSGSDNVDISVLNNNLDDQDSTIHDAFLNMAPPFSESSTYAVDDIVLYGTGLYKCHTAVVTPGSWTGSTNWQVYKLSEGGSGGGGGTSDYNPLTNKPQVNGVTLVGNKTTSDLGITASGVGAIPSTDKGANGGVAELDSNGKVPSSQLPSYVDDVLSYASQSAFPATGETGKIYIAEDTNKTYRWSGSAYAEISASLALGETSSTAYRGDRGKVAYDHSQTTGNPHGTTASDVGLGNVPNVSTNDQEPTFTEASTRNNIASGEKLSVIFGKIQKFFNDLKTVAFSGSYTDLSNKPTIPTTALGITYDNTDSGLTATDVQGVVDEVVARIGNSTNLPKNAGIRYYTLPYDASLNSKSQIQTYLQYANISKGIEVVTFTLPNQPDVTTGIMVTQFVQSHPSNSSQGNGVGAFIGYYYTSSPIYFKCINGTYTLYDMSQDNRLKSNVKEFTNITLNANKETNLGNMYTQMLPSGVNGTIMLVEICSAATGTGPLRLECSIYSSDSNLWLIGNAANQSIASVRLRALYYEN